MDAELRRLAEPLLATGFDQLAERNRQAELPGPEESRRADAVDLWYCCYVLPCL
jgi:hypothetical protein